MGSQVAGPHTTAQLWASDEGQPNRIADVTFLLDCAMSLAHKAVVTA